MVKQTAPSNEASGSDIAVASSCRTVTLVPAIRADKEPARASSTSTQVSFETRVRSKSVVTPGPGPISRTLSPRSIPASDHLKSCVSTVRRHPGERHNHRCTRFISPPSRTRQVCDLESGSPHRLYAIACRKSDKRQGLELQPEARIVTNSSAAVG